MMKKIFFSLFTCLMACAGMSAQKSFVLDLYNGKPSVKSSNIADTAKVYVHLPAKNKATGRCIVVCPGGGYDHLAMGHEGNDWAPFFNKMGIAVVVLKYRMPHGNKDVPFSDAEMAIRLCRANAQSWNINSNDIGIMGFSAGGHLASTIATHSKGDAKPNFQILFYPVITMDPEFTHRGSHDNLLGEKAKKKDELLYSNDIQVNRTTPPACIILSDDDNVVPPANGVNYYFELYKHDVPASLFVYPTGGHGYGIRPTFSYHLEMLMNLKAWLENL